MDEETRVKASLITAVICGIVDYYVAAQRCPSPTNTDNLVTVVRAQNNITEAIGNAIERGALE